MDTTPLKSDALVFFGASGDLAYKKIFPALQSMVRRGHLNVPVIGVAKSGWTLEQLAENADLDIKQVYRVKRQQGVQCDTISKLSAVLECEPGALMRPITRSTKRPNQLP